VFITGVNDTANDLLTGVNDTGDETVSTVAACQHLRSTVTLGKKSVYEFKLESNSVSTKGR
jgi:hypothetical protein